MGNQAVTGGSGHSFVDPRVGAHDDAEKPQSRTTTDPAQLAELHRLCSEGRLYDVERWIRDGKPLQLGRGAPATRRATSALAIALEHKQHSLTLLLLCNGYDPSLEPRSPLDLAMRARRWDLLDSLLEWGADPREIDFDELLGTYNTNLFERFHNLGVDLTAGHALAATLAYHTSNKPAFGFAKRHQEKPKFQSELNIALAHHVGEGNAKGMELCLWAGADPHAPAYSFRFGSRGDDEDDVPEEHRFLGFSAINEACRNGDAGVLKRLGPDPSRDDFDELYRAASSGAVIDVLTALAHPTDVGATIGYHLSYLHMGFGSEWRALDVLKHLFTAGVRWEKNSGEGIPSVRRHLLKVSDQTFIEAMGLLAKGDWCAPEILKELARTPSMHARMRKLGFLPPSPGDQSRFGYYRPSGSRAVLTKFGVELPTPKRATPPLPRTVHIRGLTSKTREIRLDRAALFALVWSEPVEKLAQSWGLSGRGLAKACRRLRVPVPPRGYWAKIEAGTRCRRPRLPHLPSGEGEEVVVWAPEPSS